VILTPIAPEAMPAVLAGFAGRIEASLPGRAAFARIAASAAAGAQADTPARRAGAVALARRLGIPVLDEAPAVAFSWDGRQLRVDSEAWVLLHEVAHWQLAPPARRRLYDFGLGAGPETGRKDAADRARCLDDRDRDAEEAAASLLGVLWEAELGQPAIHAFLEQNWLEGWERPSTAAYFLAVLERLRAAGLVGDDGRPRAVAGHGR